MNLFENLASLEVTQQDIAEYETNSGFELSLQAGSGKKSMVNAKSADLWKCPVREIVLIPDFNARVKNDNYRAEVRVIADSIIQNGYYNSRPLSIFVGLNSEGVSVNYLYDGHRRFEAIQLAISEGHSIETVPCVTAPQGTSMEDLTVALVTMNNGAALKPYEVASVCKRLVNFGMGIEEIALKISVTPTYVRGLLDLMASPRSIQAMVSNGTVSATLAIDTIKKHGVNAPKVLADGKEKANAQGKTRVTGKTLAIAKEKPEKTQKPNLLATATVWLARNADLIQDDKRIFELVGLLCEVSANEVEGRFQFQLKEASLYQ